MRPAAEALRLATRNRPRVPGLVELEERAQHLNPSRSDVHPPAEVREGRPLQVVVDGRHGEHALVGGRPERPVRRVVAGGRDDHRRRRDVSERFGDRQRRLVVVAVAAEREIDHVGVGVVEDRARDVELGAVALGVEHLRDLDRRVRSALEDDARDERAVTRLVVEPAVLRVDVGVLERVRRGVRAGVEPRVQARRVAGVDHGDARPLAVAVRELHALLRGDGEAGGTALHERQPAEHVVGRDAGQGVVVADAQPADRPREVLAGRQLEPQQALLDARGRVELLGVQLLERARQQRQVLPRDEELVRGVQVRALPEREPNVLAVGKPRLPMTLDRSARIPGLSLACHRRQIVCVARSSATG